MSDLLRKMADSTNKLLKTESIVVSTTSPKLKNKEDLVQFLATHIVSMSFRNLRNQVSKVVCTSNGVFVSKYAPAKNKSREKKVFRPKKLILDTKRMDQIMTFDLLDNKPKTISLKHLGTFTLLGLVPLYKLNEETLSVLATTTYELLHKE